MTAAVEEVFEITSNGVMKHRQWGGGGVRGWWVGWGRSPDYIKSRKNRKILVESIKKLEILKVSVILLLVDTVCF